MTRILIIDDQDSVRLTMRRLLESGGHVVIEASRAEEGLRRLGDAPFRRRRRGYQPAG